MLQGQLLRASEQTKKEKLAAVAAAAGSASFGRSAHLVRSYVLNPYQLVRGGRIRGGGGGSCRKQGRLMQLSYMIFSVIILFFRLNTPQVRDERGFLQQGRRSLESSDAVSVLGGGEELDKFLRAALVARGEEEGGNEAAV
jgi:hypothetical protein